LQSPLSIRYSLFSIMAISSSLLAVAERMRAKHRITAFPIVLSLVLIYHITAGIFFLPEAVIRKETYESRNWNSPEPVKEGSINLPGE
jgi:hypothetical protein